MKQVLIRIDDLGRLDCEHDRILETFLASGIPISCGIVPEWLDDQFCRYLRSLAERYPNMVEVHQHGYRHVNWGPFGCDSKWEFGANRSFEQQYRDATDGRACLQRAFPDFLVDVFSPPFGAFNETTVQVLEKIGLAAISSLRGQEWNGSLPDFCADIDCHTWNPVTERDISDVRCSYGVASEQDLVIFVLHPRFMARETCVEFARELSQMIRSRTAVLFAHLLSEQKTSASRTNLQDAHQL